jgi:hypothetical protein
MNERIKELADEARIKFSAHWAHEGVDTAVITRLDLKEFAELIVKEMCGMMEQTEDDLYAMDPSERPTEYIEWLYYWRTRFEQHFGVES